MYAHLINVILLISSFSRRGALSRLSMYVQYGSCVMCSICPKLGLQLILFSVEYVLANDSKLTGMEREFHLSLVGYEISIIHIELI